MSPTNSSSSTPGGGNTTRAPLVKEKLEHFEKQVAFIENAELKKIAERYQKNFQRFLEIISNSFGRLWDLGLSTKDMPTINLGPIEEDAPTTDQIQLQTQTQTRTREGIQMMPQCVNFLDQNIDVPPEGIALSDVYTLYKKIGEGGSGRVYMAKDNNLDIFCAIKILKIMQERDQKRFFSEIKLTAKLRHSNIVNIFYAHHVMMYYYYVMEYIDGESCDSIIKKRALTEDEVIDIAIPFVHSMVHGHHNTTRC